MPKAYHGILHPVLVTAVVANAGLALQGKLLGISYNAAQTAYLAKVGVGSHMHMDTPCGSAHHVKTHMQSRRHVDTQHAYV